MAGPTERRELAAIMFTDMVGYSALTQENERVALELLDEQARLFAQTLPEHLGREIKSTGDGYLVQFPSALSAVECGIALQERLAARNKTAPSDRQLRIRIGIHLGDVVWRGADLFGDGVNIAARLEPKAPPGGLAISRGVWEQVRKKVAVPFQSIGYPDLKNIAAPIEVFAVNIANPNERLAQHSPKSKATFAVKMATAVSVIVLAAVAGWLIKRGADARKTTVNSTNAASIVVLPFAPHGTNAELPYLGIGLSETLINALSEVDGIKVVSGAFLHSRRDALLENAREQNLAKLLDGSVATFDGKLRVTSKLVETAGNTVLWSKSFDDEMRDIFVVQDKIARSILTNLSPHLPVGSTLSFQRFTSNPEAYSLYLEGRGLVAEMTRASYDQAVAAFERAIQIDPKFPLAHAGLAHAYMLASGIYLPSSLAQEKAQAAAREALNLYPGLAEGHAALGHAQMWAFNWKQAEENFRQSIWLNAALADAHMGLAATLGFQQRFDEALAAAERAAALQPLSPLFVGAPAIILTWMEQPTRARERWALALKLDPNFWRAHAHLAQVALQEGKPLDAIESLVTAVHSSPGNLNLKGELAAAHAAAGQAPVARAMLADLQKQGASALVIAKIQAALGDVDLAMQSLEQAVAARDESLCMANFDAFLEPLRQDARFKPLIAKLTGG